MKKNIGVAMVCMLLAATGLLAIVGCESTDTDGKAITVTIADNHTPPLMLTFANEVVTFAASAANTNATLALPLVWSVSDPSMGSIVSSGGLSAVYRRNGSAKGGNSVIVKDQAEAEGVASVTQL